jgi:hypothetical protein
MSAFGVRADIHFACVEALSQNNSRLYGETPNHRPLQS